MTNEEFRQQVLSYKGMYPEWQLEKFYNYYTTKKPHDQIKGFSLKRRLATWFSPKREEKFKAKMQAKKNNQTDIQQRISLMKNLLGGVDPMR